MSDTLAKLSLALGRRVSPARPRAPEATRKALLSARTAFSRETGGILGVKHRDAHNVPVTTRFIKSPTGTIFVFAGTLGGMLGLSPAKFMTMMQSAKKDIVIFKDFHQSWFQNGLAGVATSRDDMEVFIHENFGGCPRPWTFLGSNAGGFAALYFGLAFQANRIRAFSPQTIIDARAFNTFIQDSPENWGFDLDDPQNDLLNHRELGSPSSQTAIYYANLSTQDFTQIERLRGTSNTTLIPVATAHYDCTVGLRRIGQLRSNLK